MPTYEYRCTNGHLFEVFQAMADDPIAECEVCGEPVERVYHPPAVHYKGSGFYTTDYARKTNGKPGGETEKKGDSDSTKKPEKSETKKGESKSSD
jgi:putative FmdB family regulatory protein